MSTTKLSYSEALGEAIRMEMHRDNSVVCVAGSLVGLEESPVTRGLASTFGPERVIELEPSARAVSVAAGLASRGLRVLCDVPADQLGPAALAPLTELGDDSQGTIVARVPVAGPQPGGVGRGALEARLLDTGSIGVIAPATSADAKGMLISAIRHSGPVCVLESEPLYGRVEDVPEGGHIVPLTGATVQSFGSRLSVLSYGLGSRLAAEAVAAGSLEAELVDLRSLRPLDDETIIATAGRTGKVAMVEPPGTTAVGDAVASVLLSRAFEYLDGPLARISVPAEAWLDGDSRAQALDRIREEIDELGGY